MFNLQAVSLWLYTCEHCRVGRNAHVGHYWFGRRLEVIGKFVFSM